MRNIDTITKSEAMQLAKDNPEYNVMLSNPAKYIWHGSEETYVGTPNQVPDRILAVWVERGIDELGAYAQFYCLSKKEA